MNRVFVFCAAFAYVCSLSSAFTPLSVKLSHSVGSGGRNGLSAPIQKTQPHGGRLLGQGLSVNMANVLDGDPLELCEENAVLVIEEIRQELGTIFGYDPKSREVGITGEIALVEVAGPEIVVSLSGRFWHATDTVMLRVESFIKNRIPEVMEVTLDESSSDIKDDNRLNTDGGPKRLF